jgi:hypothetical protein
MRAHQEFLLKGWRHNGGGLRFSRPSPRPHGAASAWANRSRPAASGKRLFHSSFNSPFNAFSRAQPPEAFQRVISVLHHSIVNLPPSLPFEPAVLALSKCP